MDPLTALGVTCNVIDLVGTAINCGLTVKQVYDSIDGFKKEHEILRNAAENMNSVVRRLQDEKAEIALCTKDEEVEKITARCVTLCKELQTVLEECRSKKRSILSASKATIKAALRSGKIDLLQKELDMCRMALHSMIALTIRTDVIRVLRNLNEIGAKQSELATNLEEMGDRLQIAIVGGSAEWSTEERMKPLQAALEMINDGMVLEALYFADLRQRFEEVRDAHEGTFNWIFNKSEMVRRREPELAIAFPEWLKSGSGIFHIAGKPGSGKSTLMKYLCRHEETKSFLKEWAGDRQLLFAKFFFWRIGISQEQKSLKGLVRNLLYEVLNKLPSLTRILFPQSWPLATRGGIRGRQRISINAEELFDAFDRLILLSASDVKTTQWNNIRICLFIDGLDEFDDSGLNETHGVLAQKLQTWTEISGGNVKMCVSSRNQAPFTDMFSVEQRMTLDKLTSDDIELVVKSRLNTHPKFMALKRKDETGCSELLNQITTAAEGVFLWVALLLNSLTRGLDKGDTIELLRMRVADTPMELDDYLAKILNGIEQTYRKGAFLLLATILRTTGTLLSSQGRALEYALYDGASWGNGEFEYRTRQREFCLSLLSCYSILYTSDKQIPLSADFELDHLDFLKESPDCDPSDRTTPQSLKAAMMTRCNGLLEVIDGHYIKFMHRSIPEFLHTYFKRNTSHQLDDYEVTKALAWAYLVEVKCLEELELNAGTERASLVASLLHQDSHAPSTAHIDTSSTSLNVKVRGKSKDAGHTDTDDGSEIDIYATTHPASVLGGSEDITQTNGDDSSDNDIDGLTLNGSDGDIGDRSPLRTPTTRRMTADDETDDADSGSPKDTNDDTSNDGDDSSTDAPDGITETGYSDTNDRLYVFLCRIRQVKLEKYWEALFQILLSIELAAQRTFQNQRYIKLAAHAHSQSFSPLSLCAYIGLHEFVDWMFRRTDIHKDHHWLFNAASSAAYAFSAGDSNVFTLKTMETMFAHGLPVDMVFPASDREMPLWFAFLMMVVPCYGQTDWEAVELWLRHGASPHASYRLRRFGSLVASDEVMDSRDPSRNVRVNEAWFEYAAARNLPDAVKTPVDRNEISLREVVELVHPRNEQEILDLIDAQLAKEEEGRDDGSAHPEMEELRGQAELSEKKLQSTETTALANEERIDETMEVGHDDGLTGVKVEVQEQPGNLNTMQAVLTRNIVRISLYVLLVGIICSFLAQFFL